MTDTRKRIAILGSTGSIGRQAIEVARAHPDHFEVVALVAGSDASGLKAQTDELSVPFSGLGEEEAIEAATRDEVDVVLNAIVGAAGLKASVATLESGKRLALANKESLVAGGEVCLEARSRGGGEIVPVDSEHAALQQCLEGRAISTVERIVLTASGGPFRQRSDLSGVTPEGALAHPTWDMGPKITIDSATLMNKGLEVIEAHFLFGFDYDRIDAVVHPQSFVHAFAVLTDGSMILQAGPADMRIPIAAALAAPDRLYPAFESVSPTDIGTVEFAEVDRDRFPALDLAYRAGRTGGTAPAVLNAANEIAVAAFLGRRLSFTAIVEVVAAVLDVHEATDATSIESVVAADTWARRKAQATIEAIATSKVGA